MRFFRYTGYALTAIVIILGGYLVLFYPNVNVGNNTRLLYISPNISFTCLKHHLKQSGYVRCLFTWNIVAKCLGYDKLIKPGAYLLSPNLSNWEIVRCLRSGVQTPIRFTFSYATDLTMLVDQITRYLAMSPDSLMGYLKDVKYLSSIGFNPDTALSMFIPDTYEVYWTISPDALMKRMHKAYYNFWTESRCKKAKDLGLCPVEISILASLVQSETNQKEEYCMIARVYLNRLRLRMPLQSDPTLVYSLGLKGVKRILNNHKQVDSPYNTYRNRGLPPGPIVLPKKDVIDAVLTCPVHRYIYFVASDDFSGRHHFSSTHKEHIYYANRYKRALNNANIYK